jgi:hypothetical protein
LLSGLLLCAPLRSKWQNIRPRTSTIHPSFQIDGANSHAAAAVNRWDVAASQHSIDGSAATYSQFYEIVGGK